MAPHSPIRLLLVDDQRLMRDGLRTLLELEDDFDVVGEAENGQVALEAYENLKPDVVLMDIRMPVMDGVEAIRHLRARWTEAKVIILTTFDDDSYVFEGLRIGALGYLLKDVSGDELADAIRTVAGGGALIDPSVTRKVVAEFARLTNPGRGTVPPPGGGGSASSNVQSPRTGTSPLIEPLSDREVEILQLLAEGLTNREIAQQLFLAEGTVKNYVSSILGKIDARDRTQAALRARELGLLG
ncbi:MAG TPA: response regulator transcription factor [Anaerolineales bacterium]|jgi:DNA-binding NarL/FixJ family response regulator|nr:response regulator transcription factor [Anaerolineales bacterium]